MEPIQTINDPARSERKETFEHTLKRYSRLVEQIKTQREGQQRTSNPRSYELRQVLPKLRKLAETVAVLRKAGLNWLSTEQNRIGEQDQIQQRSAKSWQEALKNFQQHPGVYKNWACFHSFCIQKYDEFAAQTKKQIDLQIQALQQAPSDACQRLEAAIEQCGTSAVDE